MNVIIFGKPEETAGAELSLKDLKEAGIEFLAEPSVCELERVAVRAEMILLDADAPGVSWQYFVSRLRKLNPNLKIVLISCGTDNAAKAYEAGVFDYLLKPIKKMQLERVVAKYKTQSENEGLI